MSEKIVQLNEEIIKGQIKELVRGSVEETLNELLEKEAESLTQAARYERSEARQGYRSGHYDRNLTTTSGDVTLHMPRLKGVSFETAIIERYRRRESSVEEALIEMYLAGVSVRRVEDITEALWGSKVSPATISELNKKAYVHIEDWRNRPLQGGRYPYVYVYGIYLRRSRLKIILLYFTSQFSVYTKLGVDPCITLYLNLVHPRELFLLKHRECLAVLYRRAEALEEIHPIFRHGTVREHKKSVKAFCPICSSQRPLYGIDSAGEIRHIELRQFGFLPSAHRADDTSAHSEVQKLLEAKLLFRRVRSARRLRLFLYTLRLSRNAAGIQCKHPSAVHGEGQQKLPGLSRNLSVHPLRCFRAEALHLRHDKAHVRICPRHAHIRSLRENFLNALRGVALYRLILARTGQRCRVQGRMLCTGHPHESGDHAAERVFAAAKVRIRKIQQLRAISRLNAQ